jgi:Dolichyl-phosphate-mannose-protein mannosyltransferase
VGDNFAQSTLTKNRMLSPRARRWLEPTLVIALLLLGLYVRVRVVSDGWKFAGSDSYGYMKLAHELRTHGRYALGPPPQPLAWVRPPLYPIFLAIVQPATDTNASWTPILATQIALGLLTALMVYFLARRLAGPVAGLIGLAIAAANPWTPPFDAAMLTETLATFLSTATVTVIVFGAARPRRWWPVAGGLVALSTLLRPDGLMLAAAFAPPFFVARAAWREKALWAGVALAGFMLVFAPWPIRNVARFGQAHPFGGRIDRFTNPVENYEGFWAWLRSWSTDWAPMTTPTTCFYAEGCPNDLVLLRRLGAYDDVNDEAGVQALFERRYREGLSPAVSRGFQELADARRRAHPLRVEVWHPITRAWAMWVTGFHELYQGRVAWPSGLGRTRPYLFQLSLVQWLLIVASGVWLSARQRTRADGGALFAAIGVRTLVLAYTFYCMPRYALEVMPLGWALIGGGVVDALRAARHFRRPAPSTT